MINLGDIKAGATIYIPFNTFDANGAAVTITGLATSDIKIYKDGSVTQRSSSSGYTLLDTDGIDFDGITGIHGFSIDLSDNTDAGFYAAGHEYWIVVNAITVNAQTVNFVAAIFSIQNRAAYLALASDTYAEPGQGAPAATTTLVAKINYLYKSWRNKVTQTNTIYSLFADDASTVDQKATTSDDGTTFTRGEIASGP